ncbi:hypothetical protein [Pseudoxanthomonas sp. USHLN014]|uniref:hypothetical protein n=1 Tax=Pseudoxanthomonas sp. USHLN014 TaxID=3081297 RepID=UPI00301D27CD
MSIWFWLAFPAWFLNLMAVAARLADLGRDNWSKRDHVRRMGLALFGSTCVLMMARPFTPGGWSLPAATPAMPCIAWGIALMLVTTPSMPPFYDYLLGVHRDVEGWRSQGWRARLRGEWRALLRSFTPVRKRRRMAGPVGKLP